MDIAGNVTHEAVLKAESGESVKENVSGGWFKTLKVGWFLAVRQIRRSSKATTGLIVFIMMLTLLNLVVVSGLLLGLIAGSFLQFRESYSGEVIITSETGKDHIENSQELIQYLKNHAYVQAISPRHSAFGSVLGTLTDLPKKNESANKLSGPIVAIDPDTEERVTHFSRFIMSGKPLDPSEDGYILIGANLIRKYSTFADANVPGLTLLKDVDVGSRVRVSISRAGGGVVSKDFIVKGIVKSKVDQVSTRVFVLDRELKRMIPINKEEVQEIAVKTTSAYAPTLVEEVKQFMGSRSALIQTSEDAIPSFLRQVETTFGVLGNALSSIALVVASITVFIVVFINAVTKRKYIGIMKAIGISPRAIQLSYIFQAIFYGVMGF